MSTKAKEIIENLGVEIMSTKAKEIIENLVEEGFDLSQIADAMCDGEYLESAKIDQETVEEIYTVCVEQNS